MSDPSNPAYERFSVVSFVDQTAHDIVEALRREIPPRIAVMPAHVTVKGSFVEPASLKVVMDHVERESAKTRPIRVEVEGLRVLETHIVLRLLPSPELTDLHDRLFYALTDQVKDVYGDKPGDGYHPHMTVLYGVGPEEKRKAAGRLSSVERLTSLGIQTVSLVGRRGEAEHGYWEVIRSYPMEGRQ